MIAALEGAPGVGKSTLARALKQVGVAIVAEANRLFPRPAEEPADWYLDLQNARWEIAAHAERAGRIGLLDGDPLQPLWFGWLYPDEGWTPPETAAAFFMQRVSAGRMRLPDRYLLIVCENGERGRRLYGREVAQGKDPAGAAAKVARYAPFAARQRRYFDALVDRFPGWISTVDLTDMLGVADALALLRAPSTPPDSLEALSFAADWLSSNPSRG